MSKKKKQQKAVNAKALRRLLQELPDKTVQQYGLDMPELPDGALDVFTTARLLLATRKTP